MATDIAFAISALVIMGRRIPQGIMVFLVALAIADDLGAVLIIALFYTRQFDYWAIAWATGFLLLLLTFNLSGIRRNTPYLVAGFGLWLALLSSGIHATIAGVLVALCIPAHSRYLPDAFGERLKELSRDFVQCTRSEQCLLRNVEQHAVLRTVDHELGLAQPPLQRMLDAFHLPVALLVIPLFALANAGITLDAGAFSDAWRHPVARGIVAGLVLGKATGITLFSWFALHTGVARLPEGLSLRHIFGAGLLGGIGFTMSIFIAELSFGGVPHLLHVAKTAVIFGSLASAVLGMGWLLLISRRG
jgi:NhaA family Na+:H+ antiporter